MYDSNATDREGPGGREINKQTQHKTVTQQPKQKKCTSGGAAAQAAAR